MSVAALLLQLVFKRGHLFGEVTDVFVVRLQTFTDLVELAVELLHLRLDHDASLLGRLLLLQRLLDVLQTQND